MEHGSLKRAQRFRAFLRSGFSCLGQSSPGGHASLSPLEHACMSAPADGLTDGPTSPNAAPHSPIGEMHCSVSRLFSVLKLSVRVWGAVCSLALCSSAPIRAIAAMQQDSQHVLSSYEELLRRPDFVLEPRCYPTIVGFRGAGGKPETAVEFLSDGYVGEGDDACVWRALSGASSFKAAGVQCRLPANGVTGVPVAALS